MCKHKGTVFLCQCPPGPDARENTLIPPPLDGIDRRMVVRYGVALLTGGYTALPTYCWVYYARLGVTEAEMICIAQLCTYWWTERDPYPGEAALAARMGKTTRTIQGYLRSLEGKGLLHIQTQFSPHGRQSTNAYDLRPFFAAIEGLARLDGLLPNPADDATPALSTTGRAHRSRTAGDNASCTGGPCDPHDDTQGTQGNAERRPLCADATRGGTENRATDAGAPTTGRSEGSRVGGVNNLSPQVNPVEIDSFDLDSIPPTPTKRGNTRFHRTPSADTGADTGNEGPQLPSEVPEDGDGQAIVTAIAVLSAELGDDAPRSSLGRARNVRRDAGVSLDRFLALLDEAAARTRDRQASIVKRRRDGAAPNGMPYLFAVLTDLLHPAPPQTPDIGPDRRRVERPSRRRRRDGGRGEPTDSYAAWSDSPARLPITEEHPVWRAALDELATIMTAENFNAWLAPTCVLGQDGALLRVAAPAPFHQQWLDRRLRGVIERTLGRVAPGWRVEFVVEAAA